VNRPEMHTQVHRLTVRQINRDARETWHLPAYQRPLVWTPDQALALVESVYEGYPIGSFLVWESSWNKDYLLLDGQQRVAAVTGIRCGTTEGGPQVGWSFLQQKWCLKPDDSADDWLTIRWWFETDTMDRVNELWRLQAKYEGGEEGKKRGGPWDNAINAFDRLESGIAPVHLLERATPAQAVEAFRRLNSSGTPVDLDELAHLLEAEGSM
jgi:hypothetical protein